MEALSLNLSFKVRESLGAAAKDCNLTAKVLPSLAKQHLVCMALQNGCSAA